MLSTPLPEAFIDSIRLNSPFGDKLIDALDQPSPISIRVNPRKATAKDLSSLRPVSWCAMGYYLEERPSFTLDPSYHAGVYYAQEAASMVISELIKQLNLPEGARVLDLCAAPGGKTSAMLDALPLNSVVLANEINRHRSNILAENLGKWGVDNVLVSNDSPEAFSEVIDCFDVVLVDAPCSGEGMFRKDKNARTEWKPDSPVLCAARQTELLGHVIQSVKAGGYLVYSTCTFNQLENEDQITHLMADGSFELVSWNVPSACVPGRNKLGHYFLPGTTESEGLYVAVLRKKGTVIRSLENESFPVWKDPIFGITLTDNQVLIEERTGLHLLSKETLSLLKSIDSPLRIIKKGVKIAEQSPKGWIPFHELALMNSIETTIKRIALTEREALQYLRGETFPVQTQDPGFYIVTYKEMGLGFIKHLGSRFNNLYPKEWRIRMQLS
jgi:16S rRNA C967 or C1407 C5-methylase (RsmB/RsmF family)/NOL1/NOP2/fmu family ribosome biogenesis protein